VYQEEEEVDDLNEPRESISCSEHGNACVGLDQLFLNAFGHLCHGGYTIWANYVDCTR